MLYEDLDFSTAPDLPIPMDDRTLLLSCDMLDKWFARPVTNSTLQDIRKDRTRNWYIPMIAELAAETKLGSDLYWLFRYIDENNKMKCSNQKAVFAYISACAEYCPFEPTWHMQRRGAVKRLRNKSPNNYWQWLLGLYTNPEKSILRIPPWVSKGMQSIPGYAQCVDAAIASGHKRMRALYGNDVDLSPRDTIKVPERYEPLFSSEGFFDGRFIESLKAI